MAKRRKQKLHPAFLKQQELMKAKHAGKAKPEKPGSTKAKTAGKPKKTTRSKGRKR